MYVINNFFKLIKLIKDIHFILIFRSMIAAWSHLQPLAKVPLSSFLSIKWSIELCKTSANSNKRNRNYGPWEGHHRQGRWVRISNRICSCWRRRWEHIVWIFLNSRKKYLNYLQIIIMFPVFFFLFEFSCSTLSKRCACCSRKYRLLRYRQEIVMQLWQLFNQSWLPWSTMSSLWVNIFVQLPVSNSIHKKPETICVLQSFLVRRIIENHWIMIFFNITI